MVLTELNLPTYHPNSHLSKRVGYYPNLTDTHIQAFKQLQLLVLQSGISICHTSETENETYKLLRFLRARNYDPNKAFHMLKRDIEWRDEENIYDLKYQSAYDVLQCNTSIIHEYFPTKVHGFDNERRPIIWRQFGKFEIWNVLKYTSMQNLIRYHAWEAERAVQLMHEESIRTGHNIETFVAVIDAAGWNFGLATADAMTFVRSMASTDSDHYPERLGMMFVINAPYVLSAGWRLISSLLDEATNAKIRVCSSKDVWFDELLNVMTIDQIPKEYGGEAPNLSVESDEGK